MESVNALVELLLGLAYTGLGVLTTVELLHHHRRRGWSAFGATFAVMAFTCGPHHLAVAMHAHEGLVVQSPSLLLAGLIGLPFGLTFLGLRAWAALGGAGDRLVSGTPAWMMLLPLVTLSVAVATVTLVWTDERNGAAVLPAGVAGRAVVLAGLVSAGCYLRVGWLLVAHQLETRRRSGTWSMAGISLSGIFPTCAASHLVHLVTVHPDTHFLVIDLVGAPAALAFLWAVQRLYTASARDWNRLPAPSRVHAR